MATVPDCPPSMTPAEFGDVMRWGKGSEDAVDRIETLTVEELRQRPEITADCLLRWRAFFVDVLQRFPDNPSAAGRIELMSHAASLLSEEESRP